MNTETAQTVEEKLVDTWDDFLDSMSHHFEKFAAQLIETGSIAEEELMATIFMDAITCLGFMVEINEPNSEVWRNAIELPFRAWPDEMLLSLINRLYALVKNEEK